MINCYEVVVESWEPGEGFAWLRMGRGRLAASLWGDLKPGAKATVSVSPRDVLLCPEHPGRISARNVLPGRVRSLRVAPEGVYLELNVGFPLTALVTRKTAKEMRLAKGTPVYAVVKAMSVVPEAGRQGGFRAAAVGKHGLIDPEKMDFLRALERAGSLTAAARSMRLAYRTAWTWAQGINRAWGAPLVARIKGGKGGGGTALTPEARQLLRRADAWEREASA